MAQTYKEELFALIQEKAGNHLAEIIQQIHDTGIVERLKTRMDSKKKFKDEFLKFQSENQEIMNKIEEWRDLYYYNCSTITDECIALDVQKYEGDVEIFIFLNLIGISEGDIFSNEEVWIGRLEQAAKTDENCLEARLYQFLESGFTADRANLEVAVF